MSFEWPLDFNTLNHRVFVAHTSIVAERVRQLTVISLLSLNTLQSHGIDT